MDIIEKYQPLNIQGAIDALMTELKSTPGTMKKSVYMSPLEKVRPEPTVTTDRE